MVYELQSSFSVLWSGGVDLGASSGFHVGIGEALLNVLVTIWCALVRWCGFMNE